MSTNISIQGNNASFHDIAAHRYFGNDITIIGCNTFKDTFEALKKGESDYAVCAIENSLFGSINETYDLLIHDKFSIIGEIYIRIKQCLIVKPGIKREDIHEIFSHPVAIAQCDNFLENNFPNVRKTEYYDTAASVEYIKSIKATDKAAISSRESAILNKMEILEEEIEDNKQNYTRFVVLAKKDNNLDKSNNKTSLIIKTSHKPGALYNALSVFASRSINLTKLQSRPIIGKAWHYIFYIDVSEGLQSSNLQNALNELKNQNCETVILGSYRSGQNN